MYRFLCTVFAAVAVILCAGCKTTFENNDRTTLELCRYMMQKTGGTQP